MRSERLDHTLQPTAVVHQLYLELIKIKALRPASSNDAHSHGEEEKAAFLGLAAYLMKQLLIHHARPLSKRRREIGTAGPGGQPRRHAKALSLLEIDELLNRLAGINPALRRVVELKVFEGLTGDEIARKMECGSATVARHWSFCPKLAGGEAFSRTPAQ